MLDQAEALRKMAVKPKQTVRPKIITISSGKGGVGKSNIVVNLGIALQKLSKNVLIFDADVGMGNDDILLGFSPKFSVMDVVFNKKQIEEVIIKGPNGISLLPGGSGFTKVEELTKKQREEFIKKLSSLDGFDFILMDTGAGINKSVLGFAACCEELVIITTPEPTSLTDAYSLLKAISHFKLKNKAKVLVNRVMDEKEGNNTFSKISNAANSFLNIKLEHLGNISDDKKVTQAVRKQEPFIITFPNCAASKEISSIANKMIGSIDNNESGNLGIQGLFREIFKIFS